MAKQSGLHQIRGKVGEHSYYKQSGVAAGLIRSINQGMSARVKTGEEYANTRLNNAEFGQACAIAGGLGKTITPKYRPMILPFSQSKMAKLVLDVIKSKTGNWGERNVAATDIDSLLAALNSTAKNDFASYGVSLDITNGNLQTDEVLSVAKFNAIGADKYAVNVSYVNLRVGVYSAAERKYAQTIIRGTSEVVKLEANDDAGLSPVWPALPAGPFVDFSFFVLVVMPVRIINSVEHILQEHCTFIAIAKPTA